MPNFPAPGGATATQTGNAIPASPCSLAMASQAPEVATQRRTIPESPLLWPLQSEVDSWRIGRDEQSWYVDG